jgi:hypothetical protein
VLFDSRGNASHESRAQRVYYHDKSRQGIAAGHGVVIAIMQNAFDS